MLLNVAHGQLLRSDYLSEPGGSGREAAFDKLRQDQEMTKLSIARFPGSIRTALSAPMAQTSPQGLLRVILGPDSLRR